MVYNLACPPTQDTNFPKIGVPQNGWFIMENPIKMDDLGVPPLMFLQQSKSQNFHPNKSPILSSSGLYTGNFRSWIGR